jgi:tRNA:m4X modification enzyme
LRKWACGTVTGSGSAASSASKGNGHYSNDAVARDEEGKETSLSKILKSNNYKCSSKGMGRACQRLIDYGRCEYMKESIFQNEQANVGISHYVDDSVSPQNAMLYAHTHCNDLGAI